MDATEYVFDDRKQDFMARLILADVSGLTPNDTTQNHAARILFGDNRKPQSSFMYTDLSEMFEGYRFDAGVSTYGGEVVGEGGYVYSEPGMYNNITVLDIASMHPTSLIEMNCFGPYTKRFEELKEARIAVKHKNFKKAKTLLNGVLEKYLSLDTAEDLAYALKIAINIVYGMTSAKYDNIFKDPKKYR